MTGSGAHLYSNGNFAYGNATTNMVFNGSNVFLNGFVTGTVALSSIAVNISTAANIFSFTTSKTSPIIISVTGSSNNTITNPNIVPEGVSNSLRYFLYNGSGALVNTNILGLDGKLSRNSTTYGYSPPIAYTIILTLPADTYTLYVAGLQYFYNTSNTAPTSWSAKVNSLDYIACAYESKT